MFGRKKKENIRAIENQIALTQKTVNELFSEIYKIRNRLDTLEGKRKQDIDELFNPENNTDPDFNRVNVSYTPDDEREYELREKWDKNGLTSDEKYELERITAKYLRPHFLTQAELDVYNTMDDDAKRDFLCNKILENKKTDGDRKAKFDKEFSESKQQNPNMSLVDRTRRINEWLNYLDRER